MNRDVGEGIILELERLRRRLDALEGADSYVGEIPVGAVVFWPGSVVSIPAKWQLCDGTNGTEDLRGVFLVGAGGSYNPGDTGGAASNDLSHTHTSGTLAADNDAHDHDINTTQYAMAVGSTVYSTATATELDTHNHDVSGSVASAGSASQENRPPYHAGCWIQRMEA